MTGRGLSGRGIQTLLDNNEIELDHIHSEQYVYPTLADGIVCTSGAGDWGLTAGYTQIVPATTIRDIFDIHEILIEDANTKDKTYQLNLYATTNYTFIGSVRFNSGSTKGGIPSQVFMTPLIDADEPIFAKLAIEDGGSKTAKISVRYHTY